MSCEHLICAQCAGPVAEGRCPVCRAAKSDLHHHTHGISVPLGRRCCCCWRSRWPSPCSTSPTELRPGSRSGQSPAYRPCVRSQRISASMKSSISPSMTAAVFPVS